MQQLVAAFAHSFINGDRFETITSARSLAESVLNPSITRLLAMLARLLPHLENAVEYNDHKRRE